MHHALFLPEITSNIFEFLNPFLSEPTASHERDRLCLQDIAAVARTCHALSGPALDVLWDTQLCLGPLLMCMSPSVVEVSDRNESGERRSIQLIEDPLLSDWSQMLPYARRIKRLGPPPVGEYRWRLQTFSIPSYIINWLISTYPVQDFLPRLTHISCYELERSVEDIAHISFAPLSGSNLTSFDFTPTFDAEEGGWPLLSTLVDDLPQLKVIRLTVNVSPDNKHMLYSGAIAPMSLFHDLDSLDLTINGRVAEGSGLAGLQIFPRLRKLKLSSDISFTLGFLTALQSTVLHTLGLTISRNSSTVIQRLDRLQLFPSLRHLAISSDFRFMMSLINAVQSSALDSLSLTIVHSDNSQIIMGALTTLISSKRGWESSMRTLTINRSGMNLLVDEYSGHGHPYFLPVEDLLDLSHLQHLTLDRLVISLNNALCTKLAIGWPHLVEFYFNPTSARGLAPTTVDLNSLVAFTKYCPKLSRLQLGIPWNMTELPVLDDETLNILSSRPTRYACMRISVDGFSSLANPKAVAQFLATVFPRREIKIVLAAPVCLKYTKKPSNGWYEVVGWLRRTQASSLEIGR
ncbi:hypothetical protein AZE42_10289 [Rhizopogon vesiculosus]|uniref:F-box domain-containing protein n=1 Tax=Rhizopogon vesiculosus TaxID=180088 RepID=A0A1J8R8Y0_9AGAM|nr:hypothetical protein AZE42_10289 [Rhizopogon vesiculosus]